MVEIHKNPSQSERKAPSPIEKVFERCKLHKGKTKDLEKAHGQYIALIKRDENFKRKFPDKVSQDFFLFYEYIIRDRKI
jgi:hypothetical protein